MDKSLLHEKLVSLISAKVELATQSQKMLIEARNQETKSTAGDKHETSRALAQTEIDKLASQLNLLNSDLAALQQIKPAETNIFVGKGSLVTTNKAVFYISIGYGKLDDGIYAISLESPVAIALKGAKVGEKIKLQTQEYTILSIA
jgi:transcription elongation GreA/GreB family factor